MSKNSRNKKILIEIGKNLNFRDKIIMNIFKEYTFKIYIKGVKAGFNLK